MACKYNHDFCQSMPNIILCQIFFNAFLNFCCFIVIIIIISSSSSSSSSILLLLLLRSIKTNVRLIIAKIF